MPCCLAVELVDGGARPGGVQRAASKVAVAPTIDTRQMNVSFRTILKQHQRSICNYERLQTSSTNKISVLLFESKKPKNRCPSPYSPTLPHVDMALPCSIADHVARIIGF